MKARPVVVVILYNIPVVTEIRFSCSLWIPKRVLFVLRGSAVAMAMESPTKLAETPLSFNASQTWLCVSALCRSLLFARTAGELIAVQNLFYFKFTVVITVSTIYCCNKKRSFSVLVYKGNCLTTYLSIAF